MKLIVEWKAPYGRTGTIGIGDATCDLCGLGKVCLLIDSSEGEYGPGAICADCAMKAFKASETQGPPE